MTWRAEDTLRLTALALIWSASFVLLRVLSPALGPLWVATGRLLLGGGVLALGVAATAGSADVRAHWRAYLFIGIVNCALPFALYAWAALWLPASYLVILNAATPLFAAVLAALVLRERLHATKLAGLVAGIAGVVLVTRAVPMAADATFLAAAVAALGAAACYAIAGVWLKRHGTGLAPPALGAWSQLFAGMALLPLAASSRVPGPVDGVVVADLLVLAVVCSGLAFLLYYRLVRDVGPTRALTVTFLMPAFGMVWGAWLLHETITMGMVAGGLLVVAGTAAVVRAPTLASSVRAAAA